MRIARLMIERFRGLQLLAWDPAPGINCLVGPADSGKTTVLAALELLLGPWQPTLFEFDYWRRNVDAGFLISAILVDLPPEFVSSFRVPPLHGWANGRLLALPEDGSAPALHVLVRGTSDLEAEHAIVLPSGEEARFTIGHRQQLHVTRLNWDRTEAELRLGRGSLLQRHLGDHNLRAALTGTLASASERIELPTGVQEGLARISGHYSTAGLPHELLIGLQSPRRESLLGLLGLLEGRSHESAIPLTLAGVGTKRFAAFELAATLGTTDQVVLVDEPEVGLEPYRQRRFVMRLRELIERRGQAFLTTHSPAVLSVLKIDEVARLARGRCPLALPTGVLERLVKEDPEALLARLPVLCEGKTEAGVLSVLLPWVAASSVPFDLDSLGVRLVTRGGQPAILDESKALAGCGIHHGIFVDNEPKLSGTRASLSAHSSVVMGTWDEVCNIEGAVGRWLPLDQVPRLIELAARLNGLNDLAVHQAISERAGKPGKFSVADLAGDLGEDVARRGLTLAMDQKKYFKSQTKGAELGRFLLSVGVPTQIDAVVRRFWEELQPLVKGVGG